MKSYSVKPKMGCLVLPGVVYADYENHFIRVRANQVSSLAITFVSFIFQRFTHLFR